MAEDIRKEERNPVGWNAWDETARGWQQGVDGGYGSSKAVGGVANIMEKGAGAKKE